jgi:hypothetical protein
VAAITRRTWANLRDEALRRIGRQTSSDASGRVEYWIDAVYRDLCLTYHHYELDAIAVDQAIAAAATSLALPADCYVVVAVKLKSDAGVELGRLTKDRAGYLLGGVAEAAAEPESYSRWASTIYFQAPANAAYKADIFYYRQPTAPDFSSGSPEWDRLWDEYLVAGAVDAALRGYWAPDLAVTHGETLKEFLGRVVNPTLVSGILADDQDSPTIDRPHGGAQG